jgi:SulP family sulfate permease
MAKSTQTPAVPSHRWPSGLPAWLSRYRSDQYSGDISAGIVVAIMLVPQSLAYAMLAGVPPQMGIFASIAPLVVYAFLGSSMTLAVGPVAVCSLLTATALQPIAAQGSWAYVQAALLLTLLSGVVLFLCGLFRFGFISQLLSGPVNNGFTMGTGMLILVSQLPSLVGLENRGDSVWHQLISLSTQLRNINFVTAVIGGAALALLWLAKHLLPRALQGLGCPRQKALIVTRLSPLLVLIVATVCVDRLQLDKKYDVAVVGALPAQLPSLTTPHWNSALIADLLIPSMTLALIGFIGSLSMAQALAATRRERVDVNVELRAIGAANIASALSGGCAVSGGFARSAVNVAAGAQTPLAGIVTALLMTGIAVGVGDAMACLPRAALAAMIIIALASLVDLDNIKRTWRFDRADAAVQAATAVGILTFGIAEGIALGVMISLGTLIWRSSTPHVVELGKAADGPEFRSAAGFKVKLFPGICFLRVDENLLFCNASAVEQMLYREVERKPSVTHVVLVMSYVVRIDSTGLAMLRDVNRQLNSRQIQLHLADINDPLRERLAQTLLPLELEGSIFQTTQEALSVLMCSENESEPVFQSNT